MAMWSDIKRMFGMQQGLYEKEAAQAKKEIANIDWNKVSQESPKLGWDTDKTNVQDAQEAKQVVEDFNDQKNDGKMLAAGLDALSGIGKAMSSSASSMSQPKMQFGSVEQAMGGPVDVMAARRKALMELLNKGS